MILIDNCNTYENFEVLNSNEEKFLSNNCIKT